MQMSCQAQTAIFLNIFMAKPRTAIYNISQMASEPVAGQAAPTKLIYNVFDRNAKKIATLIRMANMQYETQTTNEDGVSPHCLQTPNGELTNEYEIIYYIINESRELNLRAAAVQATDPLSPTKSRSSQNQSLQKSRAIGKLESEDKFITAKMYQKLFDLRCTLFPLLHQFYQYLTGKQKTRKSKYDSLMNKIKKEVGKLDADINQHPELYHGQSNFLNILISCELFMACKFVFEQKFRKSKYSLFNKYDKISRKEEFVDVHGKSDLCQKEYIPTQFLEEEPLQAQQAPKNFSLPPEIIKMSTNIIPHSDPNRNELLYTFFRNTFSVFTECKANYFPYFWLMFEELHCSLVQITQSVADQNKESSHLKLKSFHRKIMHQLNTQIDFGMLGLYQSQKDNQYITRGIVCLGSKPFEQLESGVKSHNDFEQFRLHKVNVGNEKQKKEVEALWEHSMQNTVHEEINLVVILHI